MTNPTCYHQRKTVVWTDVSNDGERLVGRQLRHQCDDCGRLLPNALPHSMAAPATPQIDLKRLQRWIENDRAQWNLRRTESKQIDEQRRAEWRARYDQYLLSERWMLKREKVFARSGGVCEGCREAKATAVHHLTYDHLGNELLWELAAVCRECHERAHDIGNPSQPRHQPPIHAYRPALRDVPEVFDQAQEVASEAEMSGRDDQQRGGDVGLQSLRLDRRRAV